jgi:Xaa-Pro aminopeptidase
VKSRPVVDLVTLLGDIDDAAVVVVAGNFFHPESTSDLAKFIAATLEHLPTLRDQIAAFTKNVAPPIHRATGNFRP